MANLDLYNNAFDNFTQRTYQPQTQQNRLQMAYSQAMKNKPAQWGYMISDMMPSIAEMVAYGTTKGAFNQGRIADALEREKGRRIAYNQMLRENDERQANDYVQMAKDQLGIDMALDDRERAKEDAQINRDTQRDNTLRAYNLELDKLENLKEQQRIANDRAERALILQEQALKNKPAEMTPEEKLAWELKAEDAKANAKAKREAEQDLNKANAEYESFKSNISNLQDLSKKSGSTVSRAIGGVGNLFDVITGKDTGITKPNDAMQEVKAQLVQAIFKANGIDGDKINKEQSKIILRQAGMPDSGDLSQSQVNTIIKNIDSIYKQRIAGKKNLADSFNSVSWE